ncbi:MAG TPA: type II secretion system protein [Patescibacteria group bacterium]
MKKLSTFIHKFSFKPQAGFTLIELLVVIGILGVLAAALVATIDPFEQLKKANDANVKNTAVEFINANIRYYTTHNHMPWADNCLGAGVTAPSSSPLYPNMTTCLQTLALDGEIKGAFTTVTSVLSSIIITGDDTSVTACFLPQSKAQRADANTKWDNTGSTTLATNLCGPTSTLCYWCSQ